MNSFLSWVGGKSHLTSTIIPYIPPHHCYAEVFCGAAWLLFRKEQSKTEIINDLNGDLINLYRVVQNHLKEFVEHLKWLLVARDEFERFMLETPESLTDIQRAVRFYYIMRTGYGARLKSPSFSVGPARPSNFNLLRVEEDLSAAHLRLSRVYIENKPYQEFIHRYDRTDTFFYLDPPYFGYEDYYGKNLFSRQDFEKLRDALCIVKGKWMLSINDVPEIRALFSDFRFVPVVTRYSTNVKSNKNKRGQVQELLIMNY